MNPQNKIAWSIVSAVLVISLLLYAVYNLHAKNLALKNNVGALESTLRISQKDLAEATSTDAKLSEALTAEEQRASTLQKELETLTGAVEKITGTVVALDKLRKTDPQLLMKYSKVSFLNEHYLPQKLSLIPKEYVFNSKEEYLHASVLPSLLLLLRAENESGGDLRIISAYRSFETQTDLKSNYRVTYGAGANKFSAEQGYSEHQLGAAVDFTSVSLGAAYEKFDRTKSYAWLLLNAHRYGFILSYPKGNGYYIYEPWHWRFVGVELATKLHDEGRHFYDMDQRDINEYLVKIFD